MDDNLFNTNFEYELAQKLYKAYLDARKRGKRKTKDEHAFEINEYENLVNLRKSLLDRTYKPSRSTAHIVKRPVRREIFAAPFRDRIIHHLIYNEVGEWWDRQFIHDSYSCRKGKGTLMGILRLDHHIKVVSRGYARKAYVLKLDIQGYFMSLPREKLLKTALAGLEKQQKREPKSKEMYKLLEFLWEQIIMDDPVDGARRIGGLREWEKLPKTKSLFYQPKNRGIVIGNLTSQLLSNIYLNRLDCYIAMDLGYKHYGRYVDDFYIVIDEAGLPQLKRDICAIEEFLRSIGLTLHPNKRLLREVHQGVPFLGAVIYPNRIVPSARLLKNIYKAFKLVVAGEHTLDSVASYLGHLKHLNSYKIVKKVFDKTGWTYDDDDLFRNSRQKR